MKILSDDAFAELSTQLAWLREQHAHLTQQIIELKRDGFARPTPQLAQPYEHEKLDDRIMAAIRTMAPQGSHLERELMTFANAMLLAEEEVEDIADKILAGSSLGDDDGF